MKMAIGWSLLVLYTALFHARNIIVICALTDPALGPSVDSPALSSIPDDQSPETDLVPAESPSPVPAPSVESPCPAPLQPPSESPQADLGPTEGMFDVTLYGAIADGETDSRQLGMFISIYYAPLHLPLDKPHTITAFLEAWDAACNYDGNSTFYVPEGTYLVGPISFRGPCCHNQSPVVKIKGSLLAPTSLDAFAHSDWIEFHSLRKLVLTGEFRKTKLDARGEVEAWKQISCQKSATCEKLVRSLKFSNVSYGTISKITLINGKGSHINFHGSNHIHVQQIIVRAPWDSPNTDGIHISKSGNIKISSSNFGVGDDCVSIGPGSINISIFNIICGPGHGISVGSLGKSPNEGDVSGIKVHNCMIKGTKNGVRVKTWPGSLASNAYNMNFEDIVMINVSNPIIIDQEYCPSDSCDISKPSLVKLSSITVKNIRGTYNTESAVKLLCSSSVPCEKVRLHHIRLNRTIPGSRRHGHLNVKGVVDGLEVLSSVF